MTTSDGSDLVKSLQNVELKCDHTSDQVPINFYAEGVQNGKISLTVNEEAVRLTSAQQPWLTSFFVAALADVLLCSSLGRAGAGA